MLHELAEGVEGRPAGVLAARQQRDVRQRLLVVVLGGDDLVDGAGEGRVGADLDEDVEEDVAAPRRASPVRRVGQSCCHGLGEAHGADHVVDPVVGAEGGGLDALAVTDENMTTLPAPGCRGWRPSRVWRYSAAMAWTWGEW